MQRSAVMKQSPCLQKSSQKPASRFEKPSRFAIFERDGTPDSSKFFEIMKISRIARVRVVCRNLNASQSRRRMAIARDRMWSAAAKNPTAGLRPPIAIPDVARERAGSRHLDPHEQFSTGVLAPMRAVRRSLKCAGRRS
jgi:hypothetical protein